MGRVGALDGLRGIAALVVAVFHYLCLLHPGLVPVMVADPHWLADTPLGLLWNGPFAVSVFFVLSGFVMAAAAERRRDLLAANLVTRYLRLALPVTASVVLAWALLQAFPTATETLAYVQDEPSPWLVNTYQGEAIPPLPLALADGLLGNFLRGFSQFNNVLWTMQIELLGSVGLFLAYWAVPGRALRLGLLAAGGVLIVLFLRDAYLAFVLGALLYEARKAGLIERLPWVLAPLALVAGVLLGAPGAGTAARLGLDGLLPGRLTPGHATGLAPIGAAALMLYAALASRGVARALDRGPFLWLGRISFGLYLVHVPLLYTLVAWATVELPLDPALVAVLYFAGTLALAHLFTLAVDEPVIRLLGPVRARLGGRKDEASQVATRVQPVDGTG